MLRAEISKPPRRFCRKARDPGQRYQKMRAVERALLRLRKTMTRLGRPPPGRPNKPARDLIESAMRLESGFLHCLSKVQARGRPARRVSTALKAETPPVSRDRSL